MSTQAGPRKVVVSSTALGGSGGGGAGAMKIIPACLLSFVMHAVLLFLFLIVTVPGEASENVGEVKVVETQVEEQQREPDLTNTDVGLDADVPTNYMNDRIEEVSVPGPVDPTAAVGIAGAPEAPATTLPPPPGSGQGTGGAPVMADAGIGSMSGTLGGMGGIYSAGGFAGRSGSTRQKLLQEGGGNNVSEACVARGLEWLALHQALDGRWSLHDFNRHARDKPIPGGKVFLDNCTGQATRQNDIAGTAFGLLPFLAGGMTHKPVKVTTKDYSKSVAGALNFLMLKQGKDGYFGGDMYSHGLATIAMCEAYGLTTDNLLKLSAQKALNYIAYAQDPAGGGWRYSARTPGDVSVTGWQVMALKSGQMSGLSVSSDVLKKAERFMDACESTNKGGYAYTPGSGETVVMTAVGLLCRQYMGVNPRNPGLLSGVERLKKVPPGGGNLYYEYYATQVMHHMGGESWNFWNMGPDGTGKNGIRDVLIRKQDLGSDPKKPNQKGSWSPDGTGFDKEGGRIMSTSLSLLCLEVYYRHLPLYRREMGVTGKEK